MESRPVIHKGTAAASYSVQNVSKSHYWFKIAHKTCNYCSNKLSAYGTSITSEEQLCARGWSFITKRITKNMKLLCYESNHCSVYILHRLDLYKWPIRTITVGLQSVTWTKFLKMWSQKDQLVIFDCQLGF